MTQANKDGRMFEKINNWNGSVLAHNAKHVVVWFEEMETAYLYDRTDEAKLKNVPGRVVLTLNRGNAEQAEFESFCKKLIG